MEIFLDAANLADIRRWLICGVLDGVTTNPSIMLRERVPDVVAGATQIAKLLGDKPLSVEVTTNDLDEMLVQARIFSACAPNIVVKIPVITETGETCFEVMHRLEHEGIRVNATACLSFGQAMLAAKAGATYVSLFAGRIADEGHEPGPIITSTRRWLDMWRLRTKIIVGSIRGVTDVQTAALGGAHVVTIPPAILSKLADHKYTRSTVHEFVRDGKAAGELANLALVDKL